MAVEILLNKGLQIKNLQVDTVEIKSVYNPKQLYDNLKNSSLYDRENNLWYASISKQQSVLVDQYLTGDQLLGILVESEFDKEKGQEQYNALLETDSYDDKTKQWKKRSRKNDASFNGSDQLLGILVKGLSNKENAYKDYEKLKRTSLYDDKEKLWYPQYPSRLYETSKTAREQFIGIIVEGLFNKKEAEKQYKALKQTEYFDKNSGQWYEYRQDGFTYRSTPQLLGIYVESMVDVPAAKKQYERLKTTNLYDADAKQWNTTILTDSNTLIHNRETFSQLLGVLIERTFEVADLKNFDATNDQLPEVRRF